MINTLSPGAYYEKIKEIFREHADESTAIKMEAYMRHQFRFYGIQRPRRNEIQANLFSSYGIPNNSDLEQLVLLLWEDAYRELQLVALDMMKKKIHTVDKSFIQLLEQLITTKSWWDTVDLIASNLVGVHFRRYPELVPEYPTKWVDTNKLWLQRTALLFQLKYKQDTNVSLLFSYIDRLKNSDEFFIQKAIGWALREYSKTDASVIKEFVQQNDLAKLSEREALKWLHGMKRLST